MRKRIVAMLIAATSLVPGTAGAQDWGSRRDRGGAQAGARGEMPQSARAARGGDANVDRQGARQQRTAPREWRGRQDQVQQQTAPEQGFATRGDRGDRAGSGWARPAGAGDWTGQRERRAEALRQQGGTDARTEGRFGDARGNQSFGGGTRLDTRSRIDTRTRFDNGSRFASDARGSYVRSGRDRGVNSGYAGRGSWNRQWRDDRRYDWRGYRNGNRSAYRLPRYYAPRGYGYGYQRFSIGGSLGAILFSQNYWINDPFAYRLPPAYGPYRWVRYYNDALLVDVRSGFVVDAIHDIFW